MVERRGVPSPPGTGSPTSAIDRVSHLLHKNAARRIEKIRAGQNIFRFFIGELKNSLYFCPRFQERPMERCRSGRSGRSRKPLYPYGYPGFESLSFRQQPSQGGWDVLFILTRYVPPHGGPAYPHTTPHHTAPLLLHTPCPPAAPPRHTTHGRPKTFHSKSPAFVVKNHYLYSLHFILQHSWLPQIPPTSALHYSHRTTIL